MKGYFSPAAERALFEVSIDFDVLAKIEEIAETDKGGEVVEKPLAPAALGKIIAERFFERPLPPRVLGVILKRLSKNHPETLKWNGSEKHSRYTVCRRKTAENAEKLNF